MGTLFNRLRVGEKIGLSFGLVTLLFFGVIWHYHHSLEGAVQDYASLYDVFEARKSYALEIPDVFSETRRAEKDFLIYREERFAAEVDQESRQAADKIQTLANDYKYGFLAVADAWRAKGLDEDSGLQGGFRRKVHELQRL